MPFSSLNGSDPDDDGALLDADRCPAPDHALYPDHWALGPTRWETPEEGLLAGETREVILDAIDRLPAAQRAVITMRDVQGWPSEEVRGALELTDANQRVLLHRARTRVRAAIESHFQAVEQTLPA